ncbi:hypothetical protein [Bacillus paranthracis]|uniref:hypothetical protein n=1 Tax=Bacillus paranthracis TaxID=2026186 RepID=UPI0029C4AFBC|nr:hypothetical protein [Bacillus paranthracis]MDX6046654.1 hypothetical protein [Bacillus paranthracis]
MELTTEIHITAEEYNRLNDKEKEFYKHTLGRYIETLREVESIQDMEKIMHELDSAYKVNENRVNELGEYIVVCYKRLRQCVDSVRYAK